MKRPRKGGGRRGGGKGAPRQRPLRRGQVIMPFGIGAMNDFRYDEALMCAGLDMWFRGSAPPAELRVTEERLQGRLGAEFFVKPPDYSDQEGGARFKVPHVRFPRWHYCPRCFRMSAATIFGEQPRCREPSCARTQQGRRKIPVRIVAVCAEGHIEDFPFRAWIGCTCADENSSRLYFKAGRSAASLAGIKIECEACDRRRSLAGAFDQDALANMSIACNGGQPWLGREGPNACMSPLQTVQRGGSNVYFPLVSSSIYVPPPATRATEEIQRVLDNQGLWLALTSALDAGKIKKEIANAIAIAAGVDAEALSAAAQSKLDGTIALPVGVTEEDFRRQEYDVLRVNSGSPQEELFVERIEGSHYGWLAQFVSGVSLVRKLRETRVHVGFSRLLPKTDRGDPGVQPLRIAQDIRWMPAIEVRGEGIFVEFDRGAIDQWAAQDSVRERVAAMLAEYARRRAQRSFAQRAVDSRLLMLHTFAHVLIKELTFSCGYGSASLRERLYCNLDDPARPMLGVLVYTASGDSEGTLGGLVSQAHPRRLERVVADGLRRASWCSNDPVCMESPGGGTATSNLAACHACALLPETSCEEGNRLLDRALLIGTIEDPAMGFFSAARNEW